MPLSAFEHVLLHQYVGWLPHVYGCLPESVGNRHVVFQQRNYLKKKIAVSITLLFPLLSLGRFLPHYVRYKFRTVKI